MRVPPRRLARGVPDVVIAGRPDPVLHAVLNAFVVVVLHVLSDIDLAEGSTPFIESLSA